jgi:hypothetical protein
MIYPVDCALVEYCSHIINKEPSIAHIVSPIMTSNRAFAPVRSETGSWMERLLPSVNIVHFG